MPELDLFVDNIRKKAERSSFEQNIDMVLAMCMRDMRNYKYYIKENKTGTEKFSVCYEAFAHTLMNRDSIPDIEADKNLSECDKFLEALQQEDLEYFDECVNVTCEIIHLLMYIKTRDIRNIIAAAKLAFESAEAHFQKCGLPEDEYDLKMEEFVRRIEALDMGSLTSFLSYN